MQPPAHVRKALRVVVEKRGPYYAGDSREFPCDCGCNTMAMVHVAKAALFDGKRIPILYICVPISFEENHLSAWAITDRKSVDGFYDDVANYYTVTSPMRAYIDEQASLIWPEGLC